MDPPEQVLPRPPKRRRQSEEPAANEKVSRIRTGPGPSDLPVAQVDPQEQLAQEQILQASSDETSPIECLPSELRRQILFYLDYESLRMLVHISPVFHAQYLLDRKKFLSSCLAETLGSVAVDAWGAHRSQHVPFPREDKIAFLDSFDQNRRNIRGFDLFRATSHDQVDEMVKFYLKVIKPLVISFTDWAGPHLPTAFEHARHREPLSKSEKIRIFRALYRYQMYTNVFGHSRPTAARITIPSAEIMHYFLGLFEPWEVEELYCIQIFFKDKYKGISEAMNRARKEREGPAHRSSTLLSIDEKISEFLT